MEETKSQVVPVMEVVKLQPLSEKGFDFRF